MAPQQVQSCCASTFCCRSSSLTPSIRRRGRRGSTKCCACNRKCNMRRCIRVNSFALALMGVATFCARGDVLVRAYVCRPPLAARSLSLDVFFRNRSQSRLLSAGTPDDAPMMSSTNRGQSRRDVLNVAAHLLGCLGAATVVSTWEDYDVTHLKPNRATLRQSYLADSAVGSNRGPSFIGSATKGLAWNEADRETNAYELQFGDQAGRDIQSYNEIMERHREERVPAWKRDANNRPYLSYRGKDSATAISESDVKKAVEAVYDALRAVVQLKVLANDYDWDAMAEILDGPVLVSDLERAAATLQSSREYLSDDAREVIGFDWGACAWRHCGAAADAQESIAELRCRLGLFEPFECLFALDIVERSLRDMLAVIPVRLRPVGNAGQVPQYQPYQPRSEEEGNFDGDGDESDFLSALSALRSEFLNNKDQS